LFCTYKSFYNSLAAVLNVRIDSLEIFTNHLCALCPSLPQSTTLLFWLNIKQRRIVSTDNLLYESERAASSAEGKQVDDKGAERRCVFNARANDRANQNMVASNSPLPNEVYCFLKSGNE